MQRTFEAQKHWTKKRGEDVELKVIESGSIVPGFGALSHRVV